MLLVQSILVYSLFALLLWAFSKSASSYSNGSALSKRQTICIPKQYWWCIILFALVSGIRWDVGVDHISYVQDYISMCKGTFSDSDSRMEPGFLFLSNAFAYIDAHYIFYMGFWAFLQIILVIYAFKDNQKVVPYILILIVLGGYYFSWMNGIRQNLVACFFLYFSRYIQEKKILKYVICIILAYTIHTSVLLLVPVFIFAYDRFVWNKTWINVAIFILCIVVGQTPMFVSQFNNLGTLLSFVGYDYYTDRIDVLLDDNNFRSFTIGPRQIVNIATYLICILCYKKTRLFYKSSSLDLMFKLFFIGVCWNFLFINTMGIFQRPNYYFIIFALPVTAYTLYYLLANKRQVLYITLFLTSLSFNFLSCYSDYRETDLSLRRSQLYQFCFDHLDGKE